MGKDATRSLATCAMAGNHRVSRAPWRSLVLLAAVLFNLPAWAHAVLLSTTPAPDAQLDAGPPQIRLTFNEPVGALDLRVLDSGGNEVGQPGPIDFESNSIFVDLGEELDDGIYIVTYRVVSSDTHPIGGQFVFTIGAPESPTSTVIGPATPSQAPPWWIAVTANRLAQYVALLLAVGFGLFGLLVEAPPSVVNSLRWQGVIAAMAAAATYALAVVLGGAEMIGGPPETLFEGAWEIGMRTTLAPSLWIGLAGLAALAMGYVIGFKGIGRTLIVLGAVGSVAGLAATGHAATADPVWFMAPVVGLHLLCVAFWFGSFPPLVRALRTSDPVEGAHVLNDFSFWAVFGVALIVVSGIGIALIQVVRLAALWQTDYGIRLLIKVALVIVLVGLAGVNKLWLTPALERGRESAVPRLRRSIGIEFVVVLGVLAATVSMSLTEPPRALIELSEAQEAAPEAPTTTGVSATLEKSGYRLALTLTPGKRGTNTLEARVTDSDGARFPALKVTALWSLPAVGIEPSELDLDPKGAGTFALELNNLIIAGTWHLRMDVLVDDFTKIIYETDIPVAD